MTWHLRVAYLGPKKIRNLPKVMTLKEPIKIPKDLDICETCGLTKMHNSIPKQLRLWITDLLGRVQYDVAGPFQTSIRGNRYFLLIKEINTRHEWVYLIPKKAKAYDSINNWKVEQELITSTRFKAVGCDGAPELIKAVKEWKDVVATAYNSRLLHHPIRTDRPSME